MRIVSGSCNKHTPRLEDFEPGDVVTIITALHPKHAQNDPFVVVRVCSSYQPNSRGSLARKNKFSSEMKCLVNLRTGELAYLDKKRECTLVEAELCIPST